MIGRVRAALATSCVAGVCAAAAPQVSHIAPGERPAAGTTEAELWYAMDQAEKDIRDSPLLIRDPALNEYMRGVVCRVTGPHCDDLRLYIVEVPVFNASMAPNGIMLIFTGALLRMRDEAELALVIGHEFGHYKARHSLQNWQKAKRTTAFLGTFGVLTYGAGVGLVGGLAQVAGFAGLSQFSRDKEREADDLGFRIATENGYDAGAGARLWGRMLREESAYHGSKPPAIFASHPRTQERLNDLQAAASSFGAGERTDNRATYRQAVRPFLEKWLDGELSRRMYDTALQVIGELREGSDDAERGICTFYLAEAYRRRAQGDDREHAATLYAEAVQGSYAPAAAWREHGLALRAGGRLEEAGAALSRYLQLAPDAADRAFIQRYLSELETSL